MSNLQDTLNKVQDETGVLEFNREQVLDNCYCTLYDILVNAWNCGYDKEALIKQAQATLEETREIIINYCPEEE